jgi:hypothetical protein
MGEVRIWHNDLLLASRDARAIDKKRVSDQAVPKRSHKKVGLVVDDQLPWVLQPVHDLGQLESFSDNGCFVGHGRLGAGGHRQC